MTGYGVTYNGVPSSSITGLIIQKVTRKLLGADRDSWELVPGRAGAWHFPDMGGMREITMECTIVAASNAARRAAVADVADWLAVWGAAQLIIVDQSDRYWEAKVSDAPSPDEMVNLARFGLSFTAQPYAYALNPSSQAVSAAAGVPETVTIADGMSAYPIVEVHAMGGHIQGYTLTVGDWTLISSGIIPSDGVVTISSVSYTVTEGSNLDLYLYGDIDYSGVQMQDIRGDFPILEPGANTVLILPGEGSTATDIGLNFTWRRRYR